MHSPYVFAFMQEVLQSDWEDESWKKIEKERKARYGSSRKIDSTDPGAGSRQNTTAGEVFRSSVSPERKCRFIAKTARFLHAEYILELGTSAGISTAYLASAKPKEITTIEGRPEAYEEAIKTFENLGIDNIHAIQGMFDQVLQSPELDKGFDLIYIDGDHSLEGTMRYVNWAMEHITSKGMIILDDIYWSEHMTEAWEQCSTDKRVSLSLDLYQLGVLSRNPDFLQAQHFKLRL
jgi:predicted O-methyltransferase YrrM